MKVLDNTYCGRIFVLNAPSYIGFLFSQYLAYLFPALNHAQESARSVLDEIVRVDTATAEKRELTAQGISLPMSPTTVNGEKKSSSGVRNMTDGAEKARRGTRCAEGKTVRQLSRLWMYRNGGFPDGENLMPNAVESEIGADLSDLEKGDGFEMIVSEKFGPKRRSI
jgi:hypothetical protein